MKVIEYTDKLVAFIDILGFSEIISNSNDENLRTIDLIEKNISHALIILKEQYSNAFSIKVFSDCICISCNNNLDSFKLLIKEISYLQFFFSTRDLFFLRGGLTNGLHYESSSIIFSKGLLNSYELEKNANYPRVLIDSKIFEQLKYEGKDYIMKAPDGEWFIDYLDYVRTLSIHVGDTYIFMLQHKNAIIKQINENFKSNKIIEKYKWLIEYHNLKINELFNQSGIPEEIIIDMKSKVYIDTTKICPKFEK